MTRKPKSTGIGSWPEDERPRERLFRNCWLIVKSARDTVKVKPSDDR